MRRAAQAQQLAASSAAPEVWAAIPAQIDASAASAVAPPALATTRRRHVGRRWLVAVLAVAAALIALRLSAVTSYDVTSDSMRPTLHAEHVLVNKLAYTLRDPRRGDIVVFHAPGTGGSRLVDRIVGLPGDRISASGGRLVVNGTPVQESYLDRSCADGTQLGGRTVIVPAGSVYVLGDNRCDAVDSRGFGPVRESALVGPVVATVWPLGRVGTR